MRLIMAALAVALAATAAHAQTYPTKPVHVIVPFTPGSATDVVARTVAQALSTRMGQVFVVENRPGAGGTIGANLVAKAAPDGYTLLVNSSGHTVNPSIYPSVPFDTAKDFTAISLLAEQPNILVVAPSKGWKTRGRSGEGGQGRARQAHLCLGRRRQRHPHERREVPGERRHRRRAHPLQGHARGADRHHERPGRLFLRARSSPPCRWSATTG